MYGIWRRSSSSYLFLQLQLGPCEERLLPPQLLGPQRTEQLERWPRAPAQEEERAAISLPLGSPLRMPRAPPLGQKCLVLKG